MYQAKTGATGSVAVYCPAMSSRLRIGSNWQAVCGAQFKRIYWACSSAEVPFER